MNYYIRTYENIRTIAIGKGNDYINGCLLDYHYFKKSHNMIAIDIVSSWCWPYNSLTD